MTDQAKTAAAWERLKALPHPTLTELFEKDGDRVAKMSQRLEFDIAEADPVGMLLDWSKTHLDDAVLGEFETLAGEAGFAEARSALFDGGIVNPTEGRPATHGAMRGSGTEAQVEEAEALLARMGMLVEAIHEGALGEVKHLIHIGIGGSALGPDLAVDALTRDLSLVNVHVVSNIDGLALEQAFAACDPATTLIAVASKTFTTTETMTNATSALKWLSDSGVADPSGRVIALTANPEKAVEWGVDETRVLPFPESVGGRYSLWSSIGFPVALVFCPNGFNPLRSKRSQPEYNLLRKAIIHLLAQRFLFPLFRQHVGFIVPVTFAGSQARCGYHRNLVGADNLKIHGVTQDVLCSAGLGGNGGRATVPFKVSQAQDIVRLCHRYEPDITKAELFPY